MLGRLRHGSRDRWIKRAIAVAGVAVVVVGARNIDVHAAAAALRALSPGAAVVAAVGVLGAKIGAKAIRSHRIMDASGAAMPMGLTYRLVLASHAAGQLAWGPLGFTVRTVALRQRGMTMGAIAKVHVAERIAEALGIAVVGGVGLAIAPRMIGGSWFGRVLVAVLALTVAAAIALVASLRLRARFAKHASVGAALGRATGWALASSIADIAILMVVAHGVGVALDAPTAILVFLAVNGACALPVTPAQLGVQESAIIVACAAGGIPAAPALAVALAYRAVHLVPLALVGLPALLARKPR